MLALVYLTNNIIFFSKAASSSIQAPSLNNDTKQTAEQDDEYSVVIERPPPNMRLVLFKECSDSGDRKIMFDSECIPASENTECQVCF